jgi:hypothetical protein
MAMLMLEATERGADELAMAAGDARGIAVGYDAEFATVTFDADGIDDAELQTVIFEELDSRDPEWRTKLRVVE